MVTRLLLQLLAHIQIVWVDGWLGIDVGGRLLSRFPQLSKIGLKAWKPEAESNSDSIPLLEFICQLLVSKRRVNQEGDVLVPFPGVRPRNTPLASSCLCWCKSAAGSSQGRCYCRNPLESSCSASCDPLSSADTPEGTTQSPSPPCLSCRHVLVILPRRGLIPLHCLSTDIVSCRTTSAWQGIAQDPKCRRTVLWQSFSNLEPNIQTCFEPKPKWKMLQLIMN